jgi:hypothetical protein
MNDDDEKPSITISKCINKWCEVWNGEGYLFCFGAAHDLCIRSACNKNFLSCSELGNFYEDKNFLNNSIAG